MTYCSIVSHSPPRENEQIINIGSVPAKGADFPYLMMACGELRGVWRMSASLYFIDMTNKITVMEHKASSTKKRFEELQKNPLVFCKFGYVDVPNETEGYHSVKAWSACDSTIHCIIYEKDLNPNDSTRKLFVVKTQTLPDGDIDEKKGDNDGVEFCIVEFNHRDVSHWDYVFNDCFYNYKSGNSRHCHMILFWALYTTSWGEKIIYQALSQIHTEAINIVCKYISENIFVFSLNKQRVLVDLFKRINPNLNLTEVPYVEIALKELSPTKGFDELGLYQKVDYIIDYGSQPEEYNHLQHLYNKSQNCFIQFKYWMGNVGNKFYNYDILETIYSYVKPLTQLHIIKRYLHDVRIKLIDVDLTLIQNLRDIRYQSCVDIRYFITSPGDNIDLVAPMFCDTLLTLKKSEGNKIQDFNGILDFAVRYSNKAYPKIDLGVHHFLPTCDGGLMYNQHFYGFIHYSIQYTFNESLITEERLEQTINFLLRNYATLQYCHRCTNDNNRELSSNEYEKCNKVISTIKDNKVHKLACNHLVHIPKQPSIWTKHSGSDNILGMFIDNIESKDYFTREDFNYSKLKYFLQEFGKKNLSFFFINDNIPESLKKKWVSYHIVQSYYSPTYMEIYPNKYMFYSSRKNLLGVWDSKDITTVSANEREKIIQGKESPIAYEKTFNALKKMYPDAEVGDDFIKLSYDKNELHKIKDYFYYHPHNYDPQKGYRDIPSWNTAFLRPQHNRSFVFYCTPKLADSREKISNLPFFWCRSNECFYNMLGEQTLELQSDWRKYTLYHAAEILGYKLIEVTDKGNVPVEAILNFAGNTRQAEKLYSRLICRSCGHMIFSTRGTLLNGSRYFSCSNPSCPEFRKEIYLSNCNSCKNGLIDSRDSQKCENGWVICPKCLSCCNDYLFDKIIAKHRRNGWIPSRLLECQGHGHNDKGFFFCPNCGTQLDDIEIEKKQNLDDGTEELVTYSVFGCSKCKKTYEKELEKFRTNHSLHVESEY